MSILWVVVGSLSASGCMVAIERKAYSVAAALALLALLFWMEGVIEAIVDELKRGK